MSKEGIRDRAVAKLARAKKGHARRLRRKLGLDVAVPAIVSTVVKTVSKRKVSKKK